VLALGSAKVVAGTLTIGGLVAFYAYSTRVFDPISSAMDLYARLQTVGASIRRVRELLVLEPSVRDIGTMCFNSPQLHHGFKIDDVSFSYGGKPALRNIMLRIDPGERLAIIGASGSGKSTLARLLVRAADPEAGCILLEEQPLVCYTLASLRETVRFVPQHPVLFQGTIRENLLYGNPLATTADMLRTIEAVQLAPVLKALPHGLDTPLGPGVVGLSGGERQRLAIARSLLRESAALILDEATSALDAPTEFAVFASLAELSPHRALIVISHHISSLMWVDRFALLDQGRIVAIGDHSMLYAQSALYRTLFDASAHNGT
jgi:ABC-type multidrug transport system fused ATPase/permease subunit